MRTELDDPAYIKDMLDASKDVMMFIKGVSRNKFLKDKKLQAAIERKLEVIGEAARLVTEGLRNSHPEIPWRSVIALRNIIAHDYGDVEQEKIWDIAEKRIPEMIEKLDAILPPAPRS